MVNSEKLITFNCHNSSDFRKYLEEYLLLKTGCVLTPPSISRGLLETMNVKVSHMTVKKFLKDMKDNNELFVLDRKYVKQHFKKQGVDSREINFGCLYFLNYNIDELKLVYSGLRADYEGNPNTITPYKELIKRALLGRSFASVSDDVISGVLIIYYYELNDVLKKKSKIVDFVISENGNTAYYVVLKNVDFLLEARNNRDLAFKNALISLKKDDTEKTSVNIITLQDTSIKEDDKSDLETIGFNVHYYDEYIGLIK